MLQLELRVCSSARDSPRPFPFDPADIDFEVELFKGRREQSRVEGMKALRKTDGWQ